MLTDISKRKQAEERIKASLREKEALLREVNHRVKNNLQLVVALLELQSDAIENEDQAHEAFEESQNRVRSMAKIHEQLTQTTDLAQINMAAYVEDLVSSLRLAYGTTAAAIHTEISDITLPFDSVSPCGLLINELVSNALKHAFSATKNDSGTENEIRIALAPVASDEKKIELTISDNGAGFPENVNPENPTSLGLTLVNLLARQLNGTVKIEQNNGTTFKVIFAP